MAGVILAITVLVTGTIVQSAEAAPLKDTTINDGVVFSCSANKGILTCNAKSESGGKVKNLSLTDPFEVPNLCDNNSNERKRLSVTNRKSLNCEAFVENDIFALTLSMVDGAAYAGDPMCVFHNGDNIALIESFSSSILACEVD